MDLNEEIMQALGHSDSKKSRRPVAFFVALALFALVNVYLSASAKFYQPTIEQAVMEPGAENNGHTKAWTWWLARKYLQQTKAPDVVLFGSSQMGSALCASDAQHLVKVVDALTHRRAATLESDLAARIGTAPTVFSLASPGAMCSDALMASRALFSAKLSPKLVVIGLAPRDFIDNTMPYPAATEPFRFYSQYVSPGVLTWCSYLDPMSWLQFGIDSLPCKKLGTYLQSSIASSSGENKNNAEDDASKGASPLAAVLGGAAIPGKWVVPANIPPMWEDNSREYRNRFRNPNVPVYEAERKFFRYFLSDMQLDGIKVLVVGMPSMPMNRALLPDKFWTGFRGMLASECTEHNADFLDLTASPDFVKEDYLDTVHLNAKGGAKLFAHLADYMQGNAQIAALLKQERGNVELAGQKQTIH